MKQLLLSLMCATLLVALAACSGTSNKNKGENRQTVATKLSGGSEILLEYQFKIKLTDSLKPAGHLKLYLSDKAARSEMEMQLFGSATNSMIMLATLDNPDETFLLNPKTKSYSRFDLNLPKNLKNSMDKMIGDSLVVVGEKQVNGYQCTQVNIITTVNIPKAMAGMIAGKGTSSVTKYWLSKDIPGYENMMNLMKSRPKMMNGINADMYQYGVPVKQVTMESDKVNFVMELVKAEQKDIPDEKFEIPEGYAIEKG